MTSTIRGAWNDQKRQAWPGARMVHGEALLAGLMETEANLADLAAQSLLIEEAQQAARAKKQPKEAQQAAQAKKKAKTKHRR